MKLINVFLLSSLLLALPFSVMGRVGDETDHITDQGKNWLRSLKSYITFKIEKNGEEIASFTEADIVPGTAQQQSTSTLVMGYGQQKSS